MTSSGEDFRGDEALDEAAAEWLCEREAGFTPERAQAFAAWREGDPRHAAAVTRVERTLALLDEMPAVRAPLETRFGVAEIADADEKRIRPISFPQPRWLVGLAAALVLGLGLGLWRLNSLRAPSGEHYAATAAARRVALHDGSILDLNTRSDVRVQLSARERRVTLDAGEAHFDVAHDPARPFLVSAGGITVRAVGTAFTVRLANDAVDVLVVEGKVEVVPAARPAAAPVAASIVASAPLLAAGERTRIPRDDPATAPRVEKVAAESIRAALAWQDPMTTFTDVPLREVVARFNRRNATQLIVANTDLAERKIGGSIALDQIDAFVRLLEQDGDVVAERRGAGEIVLRRAP